MQILLNVDSLVAFGVKVAQGMDQAQSKGR